MDKNLIYIGGSTSAIQFCGRSLREHGFPIINESHPDVKHLLLDVPSFGPEGQLRMGGSIDALLSQFSEDITIYGGNLKHPTLAHYRTVDFLEDPWYLSENAYITAECALDVALPYLTITLRSCPVLIIGWGRIGKCLARLLHSMGASVSVAARKETDRAMIQALGMAALDIRSIPHAISQFRLIYNTVPSLVLTAAEMAPCRDDCICIDLASAKGIEQENVITARGLPGIHLPESSGNLIAKTFLRHYLKEV